MSGAGGKFSSAAGRCFFAVIFVQLLTALCVQSLPLHLGVLISEAVYAGCVAAAGSLLAAGQGVPLSRSFLLTKKAPFMCIAAAAAGVIFPFVSALITEGWCSLLSLTGGSAGSMLLNGDPWERGAVIFTGLVLSPAAEETVWRGWGIEFLLSGGGRGSWRQVLLISAAGSVFFALIHFSAVDFPALFLLGTVLGCMRVYSGSILPCIIMHFVNNALITVFFLTA